MRMAQLTDSTGKTFWYAYEESSPAIATMTDFEGGFMNLTVECDGRVEYLEKGNFSLCLFYIENWGLKALMDNISRNQLTYDTL